MKVLLKKDGRVVLFDSSSGWTNIYSDGRYKRDRGVDYYFKRVGEQLICVRHQWTNWQGEEDDFQLLEGEEEIIDALADERHPDRAAEALEKAGITPPPL